MKLSSLQVNSDLAKNGKRFDFGEPENGKQAYFIVGHATNNQAKLNRLVKEAQAKLPFGKSVKDERLTEITKQSMCGTVLIGFGGITDDAGQDLEVNEKNMLAILDTPACYAFIASRSVELANFQTAQEEQAQGETKSGPALES